MIIPIGNPLPVSLLLKAAASQTFYQGYFATASPTTGYVSTNVGTTVGQIPAGVMVPPQTVQSSTIAGAAALDLDQRPYWGIPASTTSLDFFYAYDLGTPFFISSYDTPGKLSSLAGVKRQLGGIVLGLDPFGTGTPVIWTGVVPWMFARSQLLAGAATIAGDSFALTANTTRAEATLRRGSKVPAQVTQVRIIADAGFISSDTQYWTITVAKRTAAAPGTAVTVASATLQTTGGGGIGTLTAWLPCDVTLTATAADLQLLDTDILTVTCTTAGTSAGIARLTVEVIGKVG
jgi:hypothetical protein